MNKEHGEIEISQDWFKHLEEEFQKDYMQALRAFLQSEKAQKKVICPPSSQMFAAFNHVDFDNVKVVILGQDPYHGVGQAHGLSFSVPKGVRPPPSLVNIYKELAEDVEFVIPKHGSLEYWADQGVLLLNSVLTVEHTLAASHQGKGWELFTDAAIRELNEQREGIVFLLWGSYAQKKGQIIDPKKHCVLKTVHPSPLSAYRGFFGCKHFSKANAYLESIGAKPIDWSVPE